MPAAFPQTISLYGGATEFVVGVWIPAGRIVETVTNFHSQRWKISRSHVAYMVDY